MGKGTEWPKQSSYNRFCLSLLDRSIEDLSDHGAWKELTESTLQLVECLCSASKFETWIKWLLCIYDLSILSPRGRPLRICGAFDFSEEFLFKAPPRGPKIWSNLIKYPPLACIASVSVRLGSKESRNGILPARNWGKSQNKKEGVGEGEGGFPSFPSLSPSLVILCPWTQLKRLLRKLIPHLVNGLRTLDSLTKSDSISSTIHTIPTK